jgi:hypothetical protein
MKTEYIVVFDSPRGPQFLGYCRVPVSEYPDAKKFTSKRKAETEARAVNKPSTVITTAEYCSS